MNAMNYFSYKDRVAHLCDIYNLPEQRFLEFYKFVKESHNEDRALAIVLESMSHFKYKLDQINMDLHRLGLLKKVTYEEL